MYIGRYFYVTASYHRNHPLLGVWSNGGWQRGSNVWDVSLLIAKLRFNLHIYWHGWYTPKPK